MKKFIAIAAMAIACLSVNAQQRAHSFSLQPKIGLTAGTTTADGDQDCRLGITTGVEGLYQINRWFGISAGLNYSQYGTKFKEDHYTETCDLDYLTIPALANFYVAHNLALKTGFEFATKVNGDGESSMVSIPLGISYEFDCGIVLDGRCNLGLTDVWKHRDAKQVTGMFTVGYKFKFK